jgi:hypothetical protein
MPDHPYKRQSDSAFWNRAFGKTPPGDVDPVIGSKFKIAPGDRVATAGSCFAQHISRHLRNNGFCYFVTETAHPIVPPELHEQFGYGTFSARFGNIYTSRQLLQLFLRAFGVFQPAEDIWRHSEGHLIDPFRPNIQPGGFLTEFELLRDRDRHFAAVRRMFLELDIFVFTLGLTECWASQLDDAVFPICPGVAGGVFDETRHRFLNLSVVDVVQDIDSFLRKLKQVNDSAKVILTVSPVPLAATAENSHVLVATTYSKAVLRVAAETIAKNHSQVAYFPSYEIITGAFNRGAYFAPDLRSVTEAGVGHVMRLFLNHYANRTLANDPNRSTTPSGDSHTTEMQRLVEVNCDEETFYGGMLTIERTQAEQHRIAPLQLTWTDIDFTAKKFSGLLLNANGLSCWEPWGRWSDASDSELVRFVFLLNLPDRFRVFLQLRTFGPNLRTPIPVRSGNCEVSFIVTTEDLCEIHLDFEHVGKSNVIEFKPPFPSRPSDYSADSSDTRSIAIGFTRMTIFYV